MRKLFEFATAVVLLVVIFTCTGVAAPKVAVFDFELIDTSLEGATYGTRPDQQARVAALGETLRSRLAKSGRVEIVDIAPVEAQARAANLRACGGCDAALALKVDAQFSIVGWVQKVSNLILNMNIMVTDAASGRVVSVKSVDMRGNTDESWSRALDWLIRYDLLAPAGQGVFP